MKKILVLSFIGDDRPGLISDISELIAEYKGNWMESRLAQLAGKFAGIIQISVPEKNIDGLHAALTHMSGDKLSWLMEPCEQASTAMPYSRRLTVDLVGNDRPGIVHDVTEVLSAMKLNVEEMTSEFSDAPMSSEKLFHATITIAVPDAIEIGEIQDNLESLANELMIEIEET